MQPLRRNHGRYCGERIHIDPILSSFRSAAAEHGWPAESIPYGVDEELLALTRSPVAPNRRVYISSGVHGDEPAGPMTLLRLLEENEWPTDVGFWLCPCLNPSGFPLNTRENRDGIDLNRDYREPKSAEVTAHIHWLEQQPAFDLAIHLHEDWESTGFYMYELNPNHHPTISRQVIAAVKEICPIDMSVEIDGMAADRGVITPEVDPANRSEWPEAFYVCQNGTRLGYTVEGPSDFPLHIRIDALKAAVNALLQ